MRIIPGVNYSSSSHGLRRSRSQIQRDAAREAAQNRAMARYIHLACGHYSTLEIHVMYANWRPKKGASWCENCSDWVEIAKPPIPQYIPDEPLF